MRYYLSSIKNFTIEKIFSSRYLILKIVIFKNIFNINYYIVLNIFILENIFSISYLTLNFFTFDNISSSI